MTLRAIKTEYRPATNTRGARYVASDGSGNRASVQVSGDWTDNVKQGHEAAVRAFCAKLNWSGTLVRGSFFNGPEVWVFRQSGTNCADEIAVNCDAVGGVS